MALEAQVTIPFSILPFVLAGGFLLIWLLIVWLKFREHLHSARHDQEARSHVVSVRQSRTSPVATSIMWLASLLPHISFGNASLIINCRSRLGDSA